MQNPQEELRAYRNQIYRDINFLMNSRVNLLKEFSEDKNKVLWGGAVGGLSSLLYDSLCENLVTTLSWLYSESKVDKRSLYWYLDQVSSHCKEFSKTEIELQIKKLQGSSEVIDRIKTVRDKWVAHRDCVAFRDPAAFLRNFSIDLKDFEGLVSLAEQIVNEHFIRFEDTEVLFGLPGVGINALAKGEQARIGIIKFAEKVALLRRGEDGEEKKNQAIEELLRGQGLL